MLAKCQCHSTKKEGKTSSLLQATSVRALTQDVLAVLVRERLEVRHQASAQRQLEHGQRGLRAHDHDFGLEVLHHEAQERVSLRRPFLFLLVVLGAVVLQQTLEQIVLGLELVAQRSGQRVAQRHVNVLQFLDFAAQDLGSVGQFDGLLAIDHEGRAFCTDRTVHQATQFSFGQTVAVLDDVGDEVPGARGSEATGSRCRVEAEQLVLERGQETHHGRVDVRVQRPCLPVFEVRTHVDVDEAVGDRGRHAVGDTLVGFAVTGRDDHAVLGNVVLAQLAVQHQLVRAGLHGRRRSVEFVEQDEDLGVRITRQAFRRGPAHHGLGDHLAGFGIHDFDGGWVGDAAQVSGVHLGEANVHETVAHFLGQRGDHGRLCDTRGAPDESRTAGRRHCLDHVFHLGRAKLDSIVVLAHVL